MSAEPALSPQPYARPLMSRGVAIYFVVLFVLTLIALAPGVITVGLLLFIVPGLVLIASATLLYYSIALLPAYFINRATGMKLLAAAVAVVSLAAAALLPYSISRFLLYSLVAADHSDPPASVPPRSFELPEPQLGNYWTNWRRPESHLRFPPPPCADLCQQLLFTGNAEQVFVGGDASQDPLASGDIIITGGKAYHLIHNGSKHVIRLSEISHDKSAHEIPVERALNPAAFFKPKWRRYRLQQLETCPDTFSLIEGKFARQVVGGRCLLEDTVDSPDADVVLSIKPPNASAARQEHSDLRVALSDIKTGPTTVTITEKRDGRAVPVEVKTTLVAQYATAPFYFTTARCGGGGEIPNLCLVAASEPFPSSSAEPFEMIARRYGYAITPTPLLSRFSVPVSDQDRTAVTAMLKRDYGANGFIPTAPSNLIASFVNERLQSGELNQDDIELFRALLKQHAFAAAIDSNFPASTYAALKPLLPEMFERIAYNADGQDVMVDWLNSMLRHFSAADTDPYWLALCQDAKNARLWICSQRARRKAHGR